jgi:hypothetical protein
MKQTTNEIWFDFQQEQEVFVFSEVSRPALGHTQSYQHNGYGQSLSGAEYKASHSLPSSAKIKNAGSYTSIPPYTYMVCTGTTLHHYTLLHCILIMCAVDTIICTGNVLNNISLYIIQQLNRSLARYIHYVQMVLLEESVLDLLMFISMHIHMVTT